MEKPARSQAALLSVLLILALGVSVSACQSRHERDARTDRAAVNRVLDSLHERAAAADFDGYFALYHPDAVFMGTDRAEYWSLPAFKAYTRTRFATGAGWTYVPSERFVHLRDDVAWFEERVQHQRYGETRGTGVLVFESGRWQIVQYNLTLPIPNDLFDQVARDIFNYYRR